MIKINSNSDLNKIEKLLESRIESYIVEMFQVFNIHKDMDLNNSIAYDIDKYFVYLGRYHKSIPEELKLSNLLAFRDQDINLSLATYDHAKNLVISMIRAKIASIRDHLIKYGLGSALFSDSNLEFNLLLGKTVRNKKVHFKVSYQSLNYSFIRPSPKIISSSLLTNEQFNSIIDATKKITIK